MDRFFVRKDTEEVTEKSLSDTVVTICNGMSEVEVGKLIGKNALFVTGETLKTEVAIGDFFERISFSVKNLIFEDASALVKTAGYKYLKSNIRRLQQHRFYIPNEDGTVIDIDLSSVYEGPKVASSNDIDYFASHEEVSRKALSDPSVDPWRLYELLTAEPGNTLAIIHENYTGLRDLDELASIAEGISMSDFLMREFLAVPSKVAGIPGILASLTTIGGRLRGTIRKGTAWSKAFNARFKEKRLASLDVPFEYLDFFGKNPRRVPEFTTSHAAFETLMNAPFRKVDKKEVKEISSILKKKDGCRNYEARE